MIFFSLKLPISASSIPDTDLQACLRPFAAIKCELIKDLSPLFKNLSLWCIMLCAQCLERLQLKLEIC